LGALFASRLFNRHSAISNQQSAFDEIQIVGPPNQWYGFDALMMRLELPDCVNSVGSARSGIDASQLAHNRPYLKTTTSSQHAIHRRRTTVSTRKLASTLLLPAADLANETSGKQSVPS
jgi:hypothetical protein